MPVNIDVSSYLGNNPVEKLHSELARLMAQVSYPKWIVTGNKITAAMDANFKAQASQVGEIIEMPSRISIASFDAARACYHCDATDGVSGVVPLCRKCR